MIKTIFKYFINLKFLIYTLLSLLEITILMFNNYFVKKFNSMTIKISVQDLFIFTFINIILILIICFDYKIIFNLKEGIQKKLIKNMLKNIIVFNLKIDSASSASYDINENTKNFCNSTIELIQILANTCILLVILFLFLLNNQIIFTYIFLISIIYLLYNYFTIKINRKIQKELIEQRKDFSLISENIYYGYPEIKIYNAENIMVKKYLKIMSNAINNFFKKDLIKDISNSILLFINIIVPIIIIFNKNENNQFQKTYFIFILFIYNIILNKISITAFSFADIIELYNKLSRFIFPKNIKNNQKIQCSSINFISYHNKFNNLTLKNSFAINYGEKIVISGDSGIGKTTFINNILKIDNNYKGEIVYNYPDNIPKNKNILPDICYIPQDIQLFPGTLEENIFFTRDKNCYFYDKIKKFKLSHLIGINIFNEGKSLKISGGEIKRIGFLRFIYNKKKINILDELFTENDSNIIKKMIDEVNNIEDTVIIVSHNQIVLNSFNKKLRFLNGKIVYEK